MCLYGIRELALGLDSAPYIGLARAGENVIHQFKLNINIDVLTADRRQETLREILTNRGELFSNPVDILLSI